MWNILARLYNFTYQMLFRLSRRFYLLLGRSDPKPPLLPPPAPQSQSNYISIDIEDPSPSLKESINPEALVPLNITRVATMDQSPAVDTPQGQSIFKAEVDQHAQGGNSSNQVVDDPCLALVKEGSVPEGTPKTRDTGKDLKGKVGSANFDLGDEVKPRSSRPKKRSKKDASLVKNVDASYNRPNFFVAFQVSNREIKSNILEVQENMLKKELTSSAVLKVSTNASIFKETMVPLDKLHFTLHVFHLKNQAEQDKAVKVLESCYLKVKEEFEKDPMTINIEGLGHFRNSVLFAKIKEAEHISRLEALCDRLRADFEAVGISGDSKVFKPHMTIAKMSRSKKLHKKKVRSFPPEMWSEYELKEFGFQRVDSLQILSMTESDPITGYYRCVKEFPFLNLNSSISQNQRPTSPIEDTIQ